MIHSTIHIVSHDVPYPLNYGGIIDIYCSIKALHEAGVSVILHCFDYGRGRQPVLKTICKEVHYYDRQEGHKGFSFHLPYIVASRANTRLTSRLLEDDFPILLEGIHCSFLADDHRFANRKIALRLFNVESVYYRALARHERSVLKTAYFINESRLLCKQEKKVAQQWPVLALSTKDEAYYKDELHAKWARYVPVFHPHDSVSSQEGLGSFCLYHGNLEVAENERAAIWLLEEVFEKLRVPFVVAGKNPSPALQRIAHRHPHSCIICSPEDRELADLISKAQINILPSFNETGIKLKLLNALYNGRHCITNEAAVQGSALGQLCHIGESAQDLQALVSNLLEKSFEQEEIDRRTTVLNEHYNPAKQAAQLITYLS